MNEPTLLENQLRSWTPRGPSAEIRSRLFSAEASQPKRPLFSLNWLAPSAICVFTILMMLGAHPHSSGQPGEADTNLFFATISMSNVASLHSASPLESAFNLTKADLNLEQNVWRVASFASTNRPQSPSSKRSKSVDTTNSLTR